MIKISLLFLVSFVTTIIVLKVFLKYVEKLNHSQPIYELAPETHQKKIGTPTMGGISFFSVFLIFSLALVLIDVYGGLILLVVTLGYGFIGIKDDSMKVFHRENQRGLSPVQKLVTQILVGLLLMIFLIKGEYSTSVDFILFTIDFHVFYYVIVLLLIVGFSNAVNLTDGIDGLATMVTIIVYSTLLYVAFQQEQMAMIAALVVLLAGLFAFLIFNIHPAKIFMGDTGSLLLGALFGSFLVILDIEFVGLILGTVYILEVVTVFLQVTYFKYTKKKHGEGRRLFAMAPIHHHFEKMGYSEEKVVIMLCLVQFLASLTFIIVYNNL